MEEIWIITTDTDEDSYEFYNRNGFTISIKAKDQVEANKIAKEICEEWKKEGDEALKKYLKRG